jgi:hypothetical protein
MANLVGIDNKFLHENKNVLFKKGIHFYIPTGKKYCLWKVEEMVKWVENPKSLDEESQKLVDRILDL